MDGLVKVGWRARRKFHLFLVAETRSPRFDTDAPRPCRATLLLPLLPMLLRHSRPAGSISGPDSSRLVVLERVIAAARKIAAALDPLEATAIIIRECCAILGADRATIFRLVSWPLCVPSLCG